MAFFIFRDLYINRDDWQEPIFTQLVIFLNLILAGLRLGLKNLYEHLRQWNYTAIPDATTL
jgi:hypothetical protein